MPTTTVYSATSDGWIDSRAGGSDYPAARAGTGSPGLVLDDVTTPVQVGQRLFLGTYYAREAFFNFDVSGVAGAVINSATLSFWLTNDTSTTDFIIECRARDWGDTLTTADWVPGADLSGLTLLASIDTNGIGATGAYKALTSEAALLTAIEAAAAGDGILRLMLCSKNTTDNTAPTGNEFVQFSSSEEASTTQDPKLDIDYTMPPVFATPGLATITCTAIGPGHQIATRVPPHWIRGIRARQFTAASNQRFTRASEATFQATGTQYWQACWAYLDSNVSRQCLAKGSTLSSVAGTCEFGIRTAASSTWRLRWQNTSSADNVLASSVANTVGQWHFVFGWWDGTNQKVGIYVNGTVNTVAHTTGVLNANNLFYVGGLSNTVDWDGRVAKAALGKPPTPLGDGTAGSLALAIATRLYNAGRSLDWNEITPTERTDWGLTPGNGVHYSLAEISGNAIDDVANLFLTAVNGPTSANGPGVGVDKNLTAVATQPGVAVTAPPGALTIASPSTAFLLTPVIFPGQISLMGALPGTSHSHTLPPRSLALAGPATMYTHGKTPDVGTLTLSPSVAAQTHSEPAPAVAMTLAAIDTASEQFITIPTIMRYFVATEPTVDIVSIIDPATLAITPVEPIPEHCGLPDVVTMTLVATTHDSTSTTIPDVATITMTAADALHTFTGIPEPATMIVETIGQTSFIVASLPVATATLTPVAPLGTMTVETDPVTMTLAGGTLATGVTVAASTALLDFETTTPAQGGLSATAPANGLSLTSTAPDVNYSEPTVPVGLTLSANAATSGIVCNLIETPVLNFFTGDANAAPAAIVPAASVILSPQPTLGNVSTNVTVGTSTVIITGVEPLSGITITPDIGHVMMTAVPPFLGTGLRHLALDPLGIGRLRLDPNGTGLLLLSSPFFLMPAFFVSDNGDGTGVTLTVNNSTGNWTFYTATWDGAFTGAWTERLMGSGETIMDVSVPAGYHLGYVNFSTEMVVAKPKYFLVTDGDEAIYWQCILAVEAILQSLALPDITIGNIAIQKEPFVFGQKLPEDKVIVSPWPERRDHRGGSNILDETYYGILVTICGPGNFDLVTNIDRHLLRRQMLTRAMENQQLAGIPEVVKVEVDPNDPYVGLLSGVDVQGIIVWAIAEEPRV